MMRTPPTRTTRPLAIDVHVATEDRGYTVLVGAGSRERIGTELRSRHGSCEKVALISDQTVMALYGGGVRELLERDGFAVTSIAVPPGEASKTPARLLEIVEAMLGAGLGRRDAVVLLGGGVIGDLGGLAAALFMRGIAFVQCPTTLLAQVDASVGGKVAVDLPGGKNLLGAFHFPLAVIIDPSVLATLPDREIRCGVAEMLKHGALFSAEHFHDVVAAARAFESRDVATLTPLVAASVGLKAACVSRDPLEQAEAGKGRVLLNLGHTVGHAIETASGYELLHGEAVALGLRAAARLSERRGLCETGLEARMVAALAAVGLSHELDPWLDGERGRRVEEALRHDKKRGTDTLTYIALAALGEPRVIRLPAGEILGLLRPA